MLTILCFPTQTESSRAATHSSTSSCSGSSDVSAQARASQARTDLTERYVCEGCGIKAVSQEDLNNHIRSHVHQRQEQQRLLHAEQVPAQWDGGKPMGDGALQQEWLNGRPHGAERGDFPSSANAFPSPFVGGGVFHWIPSETDH